MLGILIVKLKAFDLRRQGLALFYCHPLSELPGGGAALICRKLRTKRRMATNKFKASLMLILNDAVKCIFPSYILPPPLSSSLSLLLSLRSKGKKVCHFWRHLPSTFVRVVIEVSHKAQLTNIPHR